LVSWGVEDTNNSFVMLTPVPLPRQGKRVTGREKDGGADRSRRWELGGTHCRLGRVVARADAYSQAEES